MIYSFIVNTFFIFNTNRSYLSILFLRTLLSLDQELSLKQNRNCNECKELGIDADYLVCVDIEAEKCSKIEVYCEVYHDPEIFLQWFIHLDTIYREVNSAPRCPTGLSTSSLLVFEMLFVFHQNLLSVNFQYQIIRCFCQNMQIRSYLDDIGRNQSNMSILGRNGGL